MPSTSGRHSGTFWPESWENPAFISWMTRLPGSMSWATWTARDWDGTLIAPEFTTTLLIQAPQDGGHLEYRPHLAQDDLDGVARLLEGRDAARCTHVQQAGTLSVFRGRNTAHRVTPVVGEIDRLIAVFSYFDRPGVVFSAAERRGFYGRAGLMEGFVAVRDICSFREVRALSRRSDVKGLLQLASHLGAIAVAAVLVWLVAGTWWLLVPAELVLGVLLTFLFCPLHESIHRTAFRSQWLNDAVAWVAGFVIFLPSTWFRYFHFEHHRFTHIEGADPELDTPKPASRLSFLFYLSGLESFWWSFLKTLVRHAARPGDGPLRAR